MVTESGENFRPRDIEQIEVVAGNAALLNELPLGADWRDAANCATVDPKIFFPERGDSLKEPKMVCRQCWVRAECLEYALENNERYGIWGGLTPRERGVRTDDEGRDDGADEEG